MTSGVYERPKKFCVICGDKHYAKGYCRKHWRRFHIHGDPHFVVVPFKVEGECTVQGCERKRCAKGMCNAHRQRVRRNGHVLGYWLDVEIRDYKRQVEAA